MDLSILLAGIVTKPLDHLIILQLDCITLLGYIFMVCDFNQLTLYFTVFVKFSDFEKCFKFILFCLQNHITIQRGSALPPLEQCTTCCRNFHCPFCASSIFKPTRRDKLNSHIKIHFKKAVVHGGMNVLSYLLIFSCNKYYLILVPLELAGFLHDFYHTIDNVKGLDKH